ncbi:MAG: GNAT family N-acetyltransferase [Microbacterium sp.]
MTAALAVTPVVIPESVDSADAADFVAMVAVRNAVARERSGHDDFEYAAPELLPIWQNDEDFDGSAWIARVDGRPVARFLIELPLEPGSDVAEITLDIREADWTDDLVDVGFDVIERGVRAKGRHILQAWTVHVQREPGEVLSPPTGFGTIPLDEYARAFLRHGYSLEQVERNSAFDLHGDWARVERLAAAAYAASSADYRVVTWTLPTPDEFVDGYALLMSRMSTDAPSADLVWDEEHWDAARLRRYEDEVLGGGRFGHIAAAQHMPTGDLVAFNELFVNGARTGATEQSATLVLKEHRGNRLGLLVKTANLLAWRDLAPLSPRVATFNAEENRPMLDINEALGFVPVSYAGAWKKVLS